MAGHAMDSQVVPTAPAAEEMGARAAAVGAAADGMVPQADAVVPAAAPQIELLPPAEETGRSMVYLVTFSALLPGTVEAAATGRQLRDVNALTRTEIRDAVLNAIANPAFAHMLAVGGLGNGHRRQ